MVPLNFLFRLFMLSGIPARVTSLFWYVHYFSKGLSSKESETSLVASVLEDASQGGASGVLLCDALPTIPLYNSRNACLISLRLFIN